MSTAIGVYVKTIEGRIHKLEVNTTDKISDLKMKIYDKEGIHPDTQTLMFKGKKCEDDKTLKDYGVEEGEGFHVVKNH